MKMVLVKYWRDWMTGFERLADDHDEGLEEFPPTGSVSLDDWNEYRAAEVAFDAATDKLLNAVRSPCKESPGAE